jgi:NADPH:quinone reductase-like Zn-dependent oxidoreductase
VARDLLKFTDYPQPTPGPGDAAVYINATGINLSDAKTMSCVTEKLSMNGGKKYERV